MIFSFLLFLPFIATARNPSDTLCGITKAEISYSASLDSIGYDKAAVIWSTQRPTGYLYLSAAPKDGGHYRFAFKEGKKWRTWLTDIRKPVQGSIRVNAKDVDDIMEPELIVWEMDVKETIREDRDEKYLRYTVHIWNTKNATEILKFNYRSYLAVDLNTKDTLPGAESGFTYNVTISNNQILLDKFRDNSVYPDNNAPKAMMPAQEGTYRFADGYWVKSSVPFNSKTVEIFQPHYQPFWEKQVEAPVMKPKDRFKEWVKRRFGKKKQ